MLTHTDNTSCGGTNGTITVNTPAGNGLTYSINGTDFQTEAVFNGLDADTYTVTVQNSDGCTSSATVTVETVGNTVAQPEASANTPCAGQALQLTGSSQTTGVTYTWTAPDGQTYPEQNPAIPNATADMGGQYTLTVTDPETGCSNSNSVNVTVNPTPETPVLAHTDNTSCGGTNGSVTVNSPVGSGLTYSIDGTNFQAEPSFTDLGAGNFTVTVQNGVGCTSSAEVSVATDLGDVDAQASANSPCAGDDLLLTGSSQTQGVTYSWTGPSGFTSDQQNPAVTDADESMGGTYTLTVTDPETHCSMTASVEVTVNPTYQTQLETTLCIGDIYQDNGFDIIATHTTDTLYTLHETTIFGCDSTVTLHLTVHQPSYTTIHDTVNQNNLPYILNGIEYDTTGTYTQDSTNVFGCDSIITLYLVVNHNDSLTESRTVCENELPVIWYGVEFTGAGDSTVTIPATSGVDTVMTLHLIVTPLDTVQLFDTLCAGETFDSLGFNIVATNDITLTRTVTSPVTNCDSTTLLHLTVLQPSDSTVTIDTCDAFVWHGITYYESTIATFDTVNAVGCDSIVTLDLTIRFSSDTIIYDTINENDLPYVMLNDFFYWTSGTHNHYTLNKAGCDSVITLVLTVNMNQFTEVYDTVCEDDLPMLWNDITINGAGDFTDTLTATSTADSVITLHLAVNQPSYYTDTVNTCDSFTWIDGITYTTSTDTATYTLTNAAGCDSVVTLHLTLRHATESVETLSACDSLKWHDITYYASTNTASFDTINAVGCDSTVTLNLTIRNSTHNVSFQSTCDSVEWHNIYYSAADTYLFNYTNDNNCPSTDTLHLTILQPTQSIDPRTACDSLVWHDSTYYASTIDTFYTVNAVNCDSLVILHLTIGAPTHSAITDTACGSYVWNGTSYTQSGDYTFAQQSDEFGCIPVDTLHLTILPISETLEPHTECDSLVWHGRTYYESAIDTIFETNEIGCDSLVILNLTILHPAHTAVTDTACDSYSWNGLTYTQSGDYTFPHLDANSCTQVDTLHLTISHPSSSIVTDTACNTYTWHGTTYTASTTTATFDTLNAMGCDSTVTLHLTILQSTTSVDSRTECDSLVWHGNTYYQSTTATFDTINAAGCDSTVTLQLTINHSTTSEQTLTECDSIVWDGTTYYANTTLTVNYDNAAGCDSIATFHLIVNHPEPVTLTTQACEDYLWNGQIYNQTGTYTFSHNDANGCEQVDTLHFTFLDPTTNIISLTQDFCDEGRAVLTVESAMENYIWNTGETSSTITVNEEGTYTVIASEGDCSVEASYTITPCEYIILLPNAITPNGDGNNEYFSIPETHLENINDFGFSVYIYNRYGTVVFSSTDKHFIWNGEVNGSIFHDCVYNYVIQYKNKAGIPSKLTGSITVL